MDLAIGIAAFAAALGCGAVGGVFFAFSSFVMPALAIGAVLRGPSGGLAWMLAGSLLYLAGAIGVTMLCNVPRNNRLAALDPTSSAADASWRAYLQGWTAWNHLRAAAALAAAGCFIAALA